jgi:hypothetical protein
MTHPTETYTLPNVRIHHCLGDRAVRVTRDLGDGRGEEWYFPTSQVLETHHMEGRVVITAWIARKKGLI